MKVSQFNFSGMVGQFDPTKTPANMYRVGFNCRIRRNAVEGAFAPVRIKTPDVIHQSLFAMDDKLVLVAAGDIYNVDLTTLIATKLYDGAMSATVDAVYHALVPAPTKFFMRNSAGVVAYNSAVSTQPVCAVLQDGVTQPYRLLSNLSGASLGTYAAWTYDDPEYVPVGLQMAFSGNVLYVVSADGKKIYRSVSGRPLDFVLNISNSDGSKQGDADTTYLAVSAAPLTSIHPAQDGGFIATTYYNTYAGAIDASVEDFFGEPYIQPAELFPVGAVSQFGFANALGDTVFVTSAGLRSYNQVAQAQWESNNTSLGAPIVDFLSRPITRAAAAVADDYVFFGVSTVFGDGIIVYDTRLEAFVSIDVVGTVKQFAVVRAGGIDRLFFITTSNELYEMPLYTGDKLPFSVLFGQFSQQDGGKQIRPDVINLQFNGVKASGAVTCRTVIDNAVAAVAQVELTAGTPAANMLDTSPQAGILGADSQMTPITFDHAELPLGYAIGFEIICSADARLVSFTAEFSEQEVARPQVNTDVTTDTGAGEVFVCVGNVQPDAEQTGTTFSGLTAGDSYVFHGHSVAATLRNGGRDVTVVLRQSQAVKAAAEILNASASSKLLSYSTLDTTLSRVIGAEKIFLLGNIGGTTYHSHGFTPAWRRVGEENVLAVISDEDQTTEAAKDDYFGLSRGPIYSVVETEYVDFYLINLYIPTADMVIDVNGDIPAPPDDMLSTGRIARWLEAKIAELDSGKFNVVLVGYPPYSNTDKFTPGLAQLRWNFRRMGVDAVIANSSAYERTFVNAVHYVNAGCGSALASLESSTTGLQVPGVVKITATRDLLAIDFIDEDGLLRDRTTVLG